MPDIPPFENANFAQAKALARKYACCLLPACPIGHKMGYNALENNMNRVKY